MGTLEPWLLQYGYIALFFFLALGIIGLPVPDETLIALAGFLISLGKLSPIPTILAVYGGSICGITTSFILGATGGRFLIHRYGYLLKITDSKLKNTEKWFEGGGRWLLVFGYFILGVRHLTGLVAGIIKLPYAYFAAFAYTGAIIWSSLLLFIGYNFSSTWQQEVSIMTWLSFLFAIIIFIAIYLYFFYKIKK